MTRTHGSIPVSTAAARAVPPPCPRLCDHRGIRGKGWPGERLPQVQRGGVGLQFP